MVLPPGLAYRSAGFSGYTLPSWDSPPWDQNLDYEDVKLKILQQEGYDYHDFNYFDDRAALL